MAVKIVTGRVGGNPERQPGREQAERAQSSTSSEAAKQVHTGASGAARLASNVTSEAVVTSVRVKSPATHSASRAEYKEAKALTQRITASLVEDPAGFIEAHGDITPGSARHSADEPL